MVGYPFITDIGGAAWLVVHIVLPLSIPAAAGAAVLYDLGRDAWTDGDTASAALSVAVAALLVASVLWTGYATSFAEPTAEENPLVQYAQPSGELAATLADVRTLVDENDGTDVVIAGEELSNPTAAGELDQRPNCADWFGILPLPWYFEAGATATDCAPDGSALEDSLGDDPPVIVAAEANASLVDDRIATATTAGSTTCGAPIRRSSTTSTNRDFT